jgi:hypothetical protein
MTDNDLEEIIEIRNPEIDAEAIVRQIRENIHQRRSEAEAQGLDHYAFAQGLYTSPDTARFEHSLYYDLRWMSTSYYKIGVGLSLTESRIPLIAPLVQRVRSALHHLVIFYTNKLAGRQARFNEYVVRALTGLVRELEQGPTPDEVESLRQQITELHAQLEQLQTREGSKNE